MGRRATYKLVCVCTCVCAYYCARARSARALSNVRACKYHSVCALLALSQDIAFEKPVPAAPLHFADSAEPSEKVLLQKRERVFGFLLPAVLEDESADPRPAAARTRSTRAPAPSAVPTASCTAAGASAASLRGVSGRPDHASG